MTASRDPDRLIRAFLDEGPTELPDRTYDAVRDMVDDSGQRVIFGPWRTYRMNTTAKLLIAAAAVVVVAIVGYNLLPGNGGVGGPSSAPSPSSRPSASPTPSPPPSAAALAWPKGPVASGPISVSIELCDPRGRPCEAGNVAFSFDLPTSNWTADFDGELQAGTHPGSEHAWVWMMGAIHAVSTDPCAGVSADVGSTIAEMATAATTIGGTDATGPTDITVGGRPGKLVVLTIHPDIGCDLDKFWLFGNVSFYPNTLQSTIKVRFVDLGDGRTFTFYSDQSQPNEALDREIQEIVDSIRFE